MIVHHHTIVVATVSRRPAEINCGDLQDFLSNLVAEIGMQQLFDPIAIKGKYGFTGIIGIVTSHIAFHFFDSDQSLHFDVYSCKEYDLKALVDFVDRYWGIEKADVLFVERKHNLKTERYTYANGTLNKENQV